MIRIDFIADDFKGEFIDNYDCALARATKRAYPNMAVVVGPCSIRIGSEDYLIEEVHSNMNLLNDIFGSGEYNTISDHFSSDINTEAYVLIKLYI